MIKLFTDLALGTVGQTRGGPAKVAVASSALMGTINGSGDYGFMLTAIDEDKRSPGEPDRFRIRIWDKTTGAVVYDNQIGASDGADLTDPGTQVQGSIVIHVPKK